MARIDLPEGDGPEVTRALALVPHFAPVLAEYEKAVARSGLDRRLHELVRMRIAQINQCVVCLNWRNPTWGASEEQLAAVDHHADSELFTDAEKTALEFAERFAGDSAGIDDDLLDRLRGHLGDAGLADLVLVTGKYLALGRFMQVLGLDQACNISFDATGTLVASS